MLFFSPCASDFDSRVWLRICVFMEIKKKNNVYIHLKPFYRKRAINTWNQIESRKIARKIDKTLWNCRTDTYFVFLGFSVFFVFLSENTFAVSKNAPECSRRIAKYAHLSPGRTWIEHIFFEIIYSFSKRLNKKLTKNADTQRILFLLISRLPWQQRRKKNTREQLRSISLYWI